ncbi:MAG TPA: NAD-dependent deacylase [Bacteroidales bacterium]|nr:NAD-dependent deacylase [Bacteroidales bacterium]HPE55277.1 NAD-dependent deacylase [Bacteroidales bacterium]HRX96251.1 NAD-dependent deacylase [Bacteroidales bacterium]
MKRIVVLSGAGISAESGIQTFRDGDGLWNQYRFEELATPQAFASNPKLVLDFYNWRRKIVVEAEPNAGHKALVRLQEKYDVQIITQNVDNLHERAGSKNVLHLHGEICKARSTVDPEYIEKLDGWELNLGDLCPKGAQLRPHIVWFGESVDMIGPAVEIARTADILIVVGTSLVVYPAASLVVYVRPDKPKFYVDPKAFKVGGLQNLEVISKTAGNGLPELVNRLMEL